MGIAIDNSGARVFSYIACLRRIFHLFQLSFMPLKPYPARYARHLPHAGKALSVVILFSHMRVFALMLWGKRYSRIVAFPIGEGRPRQRRSGTFVYRLLETHFPFVSTVFHAAKTLSGSLRSPPSPRGEGFIRRYSFSTYACIPLTLWGKLFSRIVAFPIGEGGPRQRWIGRSR